MESRWRRDLPQNSRLALGTTQPPEQRVPGFPEVKERPGQEAEPSNRYSAVVKKE